MSTSQLVSSCVLLPLMSSHQWLLAMYDCVTCMAQPVLHTLCCFANDSQPVAAK